MKLENFKLKKAVAKYHILYDSLYRERVGWAERLVVTGALSGMESKWIRDFLFRVMKIS